MAWIKVMLVLVSCADYFGRAIAQGLMELYKQQVIADNRTGAGGRFRPSPHAADSPARCAARS